MKKKLLLPILCLTMMFSCVACGGDNSPANDENKTDATTDSVSNNNSHETENTEFDEKQTDFNDENEEQLAYNIIRAEGLYEEDEENHRLIEELQGKIQFIGQNATLPAIFAENKLYMKKYGILSVGMELNGEAEWIRYFDSMDIGPTILYYADGKITCYGKADDGTKIRFEDIDFNPETDCFPEVEVGFGSHLFVMSKQDNGYVMKYYENSDGNGLAFHSAEMLTDFSASDLEDITDQIKDILIIPSIEYGYELFCRTNDNSVYKVDGANSDGLEMTTSKPILMNVENIYASSYVTAYTTVPIYSKVGDETGVYSAAPGEDLSDGEDNLEIAFPMPDGHKPAEIKDIFDCNGSLVFVFDNGDTYLTDEIEKTERVTYEMTKLEEISKLNSEGKIINMVGGTSIREDYIYILMDTNELYCYIVE